MRAIRDLAPYLRSARPYAAMPCGMMDATEERRRPCVGRRSEDAPRREMMELDALAIATIDGARHRRTLLDRSEHVGDARLSVAILDDDEARPAGELRRRDALAILDDVGRQSAEPGESLRARREKH